MTNVGFDEDGNKIGNIKYFMPSFNKIEMIHGGLLEGVFSNVDARIIFDEAEIAKLMLMGL